MVRFFENVLVDDAGTEIQNIIGAIKFLHTGEVSQVTIRKVSGDDCNMNIQIRYVSGNSNIDKLVYLYSTAAINSSGFVDSAVAAPFSCATRGTDGDLHVYFEAEAGKQCVISARVDFDINNVKGI